MAHFAYVNGDNIVEKVIVVGLFGDLDSGCQWIQTSYNHNMRGTYAGIGYTYDPSEDIFVHPEPPDDSPSAEELAQQAE